MKIASSNLNLSSNMSYSEINSKSESVRAWIGSNNVKIDDMKNSMLQISEESRQALKESITSFDASQVKEIGDMGVEITDKDELKLRMLEEFLNSFSRKKFKFIVPEKINIKNANINLQALKKNQSTLGSGITYSMSEFHKQTEKMSFKAEGVVKTADGKEISINMSLKMSREFVSRSEINITAGQAPTMDPLVINFGGPAADLTQRKFSFDLDSDGTSDQISFVGNGSGFLSLDLNNDGKINDGKELFGPKSGDGFSDLAKYDEDKNGWIDEGDSIYDKLRIWTKDEYGHDQLFALGQKNVGAIYLGNALTDFSIKDGSNNLQGEIKKTGIFLREDGTSGTVQHVDLAL